MNKLPTIDLHDVHGTKLITYCDFVQYSGTHTHMCGHSNAWNSVSSYINSTTILFQVIPECYGNWNASTWKLIEPPISAT